MISLAELQMRNAGLPSTRRDQNLGCGGKLLSCTLRYTLITTNNNPFTMAMLRTSTRMPIPRSVFISPRTLHVSASLRDASPSPLETRLREGLKAAMKSKDRPASSCLKASPPYLLVLTR